MTEVYPILRLVSDKNYVFNHRYQFEVQISSDCCLCDKDSLSNKNIYWVIVAQLCNLLRLVWIPLVVPV